MLYGKDDHATGSADGYNAVKIYSFTNAKLGE